MGRRHVGGGVRDRRSDRYQGGRRHRRRHLRRALEAVHPRTRIMRLLLTSAGIKNASIHDALVDLLGKPIAESSALCIPTASYANRGGAGQAWKFISGREP